MLATIEVIDGLFGSTIALPCYPALRFYLLIPVRTIYHAAKILFLGGAASSHPLKYINS
jgi:hypothetical protein